MQKDEGTDINTHVHTHRHTHTHPHSHTLTHTNKSKCKQTNKQKRNIECYMIIWKEDDKWVKVDRRVMYYTKYMLQIFQKTKEQTGTILM